MFKTCLDFFYYVLPQELCYTGFGKAITYVSECWAGGRVSGVSCDWLCCRQVRWLPLLELWVFCAGSSCCTLLLLELMSSTTIAAGCSRCSCRPVRIWDACNVKINHCCCWKCNLPWGWSWKSAQLDWNGDHVGAMPLLVWCWGEELIILPCVWAGNRWDRATLKLLSVWRTVGLKRCWWKKSVLLWCCCHDKEIMAWRRGCWSLQCWQAGSRWNEGVEEENLVAATMLAFSSKQSCWFLRMDSCCWWRDSSSRLTEAVGKSSSNALGWK